MKYLDFFLLKFIHHIKTISKGRKPARTKTTQHEALQFMETESYRAIQDYAYTLYLRNNKL